MERGGGLIREHVAPHTRRNQVDSGPASECKHFGIPASTPFLGRTAELAAIGDVLNEVRAGAGRVLVVEGEAGVGKSRLLDEAVRLAERLGLEVLRGAADELEQDRPFGGISAVIGVRTDAADAERAAIARVALAEEGERGRGATGASGPPDVGFGVVESVVALVERLTAARPVCLMFDDFHWADPSTARTVRALLRVVPQLPLAVVLSLRPFPRDPHVERVVEDATAMGGRLLVLDGLEPHEVELLARSLLGARPGPRLLRHIAGAAGNPLFVIELARGLREEGAVRSTGDVTEMEDGELPSSLRRAVLHRVSYLPDSTVEALGVATVLGRRFSLTLLAAVTDRPPADLVPPLRHALEAGVLDEADGDFAFRHDLIRDAIYEEAPLAIRRGLHRETARVLTTFGAPLSQVAEHFLLGASGYDAEALDWLSRAARQAASRAPVTAVKLFERALELVPAEHPETHALVAELVPLLIQIGRPEPAAALTREVLAAGPSPDIEVSLRRALAEVLWTQGWL
ncbi:MAG: AAA family ATPase, partial [Actinomycetota bacterium]|nr:AAA family ATPase [Actinomycetota bacterium]